MYKNVLDGGKENDLSLLWKLITKKSMQEKNLNICIRTTHSVFISYNRMYICFSVFRISEISFHL